jgi:hypothetical protein
MKLFIIIYKNLEGEIDEMKEMASEKWMLANEVENWGLGTTLNIVEAS